MGFRPGAFAKVWDVSIISEKNTKLRINISRKNKETGEYEEEFSGFVNCIGTIAAKNASLLKKGNSIKLGDVDVKSKYNKEKGATYYTFNVWSFDTVGTQSDVPAKPNPVAVVDDGEVETSDLPF